MASETDRFFVITGGPGSGKSTLLDRLRREGFARSDEAGRGLLRQQSALGGDALPWSSDPDLFGELMLSWELRSYQLAATWDGPVFFDRGLPDIAGYFRMLGRAVPGHVHAAAQGFRYHPQVFIAPNWPEIYAHDGERKQSLGEARRTYESMAATYPAYGYELVELPRAPVAERARFVLERVRA